MDQQRLSEYPGLCIKTDAKNMPSTGLASILWHVFVWQGGSLAEDSFRLSQDFPELAMAISFCPLEPCQILVIGHYYLSMRNKETEATQYRPSRRGGSR